MKNKIVIIDPSSTEFNRGSFCYAPYLLYNGLKETTDWDITLFETFRPEDFDTIPTDADAYFICLWSYPQIEACFLLAHFLPISVSRDLVYFVGYSGLIQQNGLRHIKAFLGFDPLQNAVFLKNAMQGYPKYYSHFKRLLLSDCDMHLKSKENGVPVYPLFTAYGCPNNCAFCPSTVNCGRKRIELSLEETKALLESCWNDNIRYIHFTDEDFFFEIERAHEILTFLQSNNLNFKMIALGSAEKVYAFILRYGHAVIKEAGLEIIEIGLETADEELAKKMGKIKIVDTCHKLGRIQQETDIDIFWLTQTFFPGETLTTLNETGKFLIEFGYDINEVVGRLRTNGTKGGLGQFFQPYHGTKIYKRLSSEGIGLTERPVRLIPSWIPYTFLRSKIQQNNIEQIKAACPWLILYNVFDILDEIGIPEIGNTIMSYISGCSASQIMKRCIYFAILARMNVIC